MLHYAINENKTDFVIKTLSLFESEFNTKNEKGNTPFHIACLKGNFEVVKKMNEFWKSKNHNKTQN